MTVAGSTSQIPTISQAAGRFRRRLIAIIGAGLLASGVLAGSWAGFLQVSGNFHEVVAGELYRSGQLSPDRLMEEIADRGIRTVINLRGESRGTPWYDQQKQVLDAAHVTFISFPWSDRREPSAEQVDAYLKAVRESPKPILVHCKAGADRTGLASALYLAAVKGANEETAEWQLSFRYGHVSVPYTPAYPMTRAFERLEPALGYPGS
ncbi:fused DSP-PTPase phosphatase/NAD kinase-like protein [Chthonobacter albigriseus]|uniref:fused DSP-PTPase phosphatase/NAD kinase-like protein n=1 Tax=Chthonobacter albigriseus TaxID=1683161 RepID=UPI0015EF9419|nr:tyrosine-protein phosphatase [Chthonobacter albigriseus]